MLFLIPTQIYYLNLILIFSIHLSPPHNKSKKKFPHIPPTPKHHIPPGEQFQGEQKINKIDATKSGGMEYTGFEVKKTVYAPAGDKFTGETKVDKVDYHRSGDQPLNNFPCQATTVEKKGKPWVPKHLRPDAVQASGQAYNAFPTESTAVPKQGSSFTGAQPVNKIDATKSGGMEYQGMNLKK
jgi:hypothetical protein